MEELELEKFMEDVAERAKRIVQRDGDHLPMVFAMVNGQLYQIPIIAFGTNPRGGIKAAIEMFREKKADWIVVVMTVRLRVMKFDEFKEFIKNYKLGDLQKDRKAVDILMISGYERSGKQHHKTYQIIKMEENYELDEINIGKQVKGFLVPEPW